MIPRVPAWCLQIVRTCTWTRVLSLGVTLVSLWYFGGKGLAWLRDTSARDRRAGEQLFVHEWQPDDAWSVRGDGLGPVFNARSCVACHFQGGTGGGGSLQQNVATFEVLPTTLNPVPSGGVIHQFATQTDWQESLDTVHAIFPIVRKQTAATGRYRSRVATSDPVVQHTINTPTLFGAGTIDRIPASSIREQYTRRLEAGKETGLAIVLEQGEVGRMRILSDGRIGKFGWKAQFATLEEFVAHACAVEVGLSTPTVKQHSPQKHCEDSDAELDLTQRQFGQLVAFVAGLPEPRLILPDEPSEQPQVLRGRELFSEIGCASCHTPEMGDAKGVYSDFCLHDLTDADTRNDDFEFYPRDLQIPLPENYPKVSEWKTPPLWGVGQTAPYLHDGSAGTLLDAIKAHAGEGEIVRKQFVSLPKPDRDSLVKFLESLRMNSTD
ncbi:MAG: thiol oxidoreductase-like protein [Planctomycetaceae bacterium]|nr:thiol oxidoreductase-like protein [Planctomycetaceae bacterium]